MHAFYMLIYPALLLGVPQSTTLSKLTIQPTSQKVLYYPQNETHTSHTYQQSSSAIFRTNSISQQPTTTEDRTAKTFAHITPNQQQKFKKPEAVVSQTKVSSASINKRNDSYGNVVPPWVRSSEDPNGPHITRRLAPEMRMFEGQVARFEISVVGNLESEVVWYKDGTLLRNTPDTRLAYQNGVYSLVIPEIFPEDSGLYKVAIKNPLGYDESICRLIVQGLLPFYFFY
jgi:hypothetical protein